MSNHRTRGCSSVGRALRSHRRGRGFDYHQLHEKPSCIPPQEGFFFTSFQNSSMCNTNMPGLWVVVSVVAGEDVDITHAINLRDITDAVVQITLVAGKPQFDRSALP